MKQCSQCGGEELVGFGELTCQVEGIGPEAVSTEVWQVGVCAPCARRNVQRDRATTWKMAPLKIALLAFFALGTALLARISWDEDDLTFYFWLPFAGLSLMCGLSALFSALAFPKVMAWHRRLLGALDAGRVSDDEATVLVWLEGTRILSALEKGESSVVGTVLLPVIPDGAKTAKRKVVPPELDGSMLRPGL